MVEWHAIKEKEVLSTLKSGEDGISSGEARTRLNEYGQNKIIEIKKIQPIKIFFSQFASVLVYVLIVAAVISALLGHWIDFSVISVIVVLNAFLGFIQQYKAERTIEDLKKMVVSNVRILRDGKLKMISTDEIVPGDIIILHEGDKVPADLRILYSDDLQINEAVLTGESFPVDKSPGVLGAAKGLTDRKNMAYMGTVVVRGRVKAVVVSTGMSTEFGKIAHLVQEVGHERTPLQKKLDKFAKQIGIFVLGLAALIFIIGLYSGFDKLNLFLLSVALVVSAIPEGLPAILTLGLAFATRRLLKAKALVKKLPASETLGSISTICVDKTGTITTEEMSVTHLFYNGKIIDSKNLALKERRESDANLLLKIGCLCNNARVESQKGKRILIGDPTEKAILKFSEESGLHKKSLTEKEPRIKEFTFTSERKMMSIVRKGANGGNRNATSYVKGSPEIILKRCSAELIKGKVLPLTPKRRREILKNYENMASQALRVLAFAYKPMTTGKEILQRNAENGLIFVGLQGMLDAPRPEVKNAVEKCKKLGVRIIMLTGDSALTAKVIGEQVGITGRIVEGKIIDRLDDKKLSELVREISIFARITPEHKLRIVEALKRNGEIVAVTGDGVNDVLALKRADIGIAMGIRGTDVARDISDIVLLDDNFATIVSAIEEGRRTYSNIKKFTKYILSVNFSEIGLVLWAFASGLPLPLLPLQILWINLVTESIPALALSVEKSDKEDKKRNHNGESILNGILKFVLIGGTLLLVAELIIFYFGILNQWPIEKTRTAVLSTSVLFQLFFAFTCRSDKSLAKIGVFSNKWLTYAFITALALHLFLVYGPIGYAFEVVPLGIKEWVLVAIASLSGIVIFEIAKLFRKEQ